MTSDTALKTRTSSKNTDREEAIGYLKESVRIGDTVYVILRHVSASGMSRLIDLYLIKNNQPFRITWNAAKAINATYDRRRDALRINGCGTDVAFEAVYNLSWSLFGDPKALTHGWL